MQAVLELHGLSDVEELIQHSIHSDVKTLSEIPRYLLTLGGKRIRPIIALLVGRCFGMQRPSSALLNIAAGIELIHMATLLHDDIIDKSALRRHQESAYSKFGLGSTLLAGDFLFVKAFGLCSRLDSSVIGWTEKACVMLTEGELLEDGAIQEKTVEDVVEIAKRKTSALFSLAAQCSAHIAGAGGESVEHARQFGEQLGIAFQLVDDILDVRATEDILGKPAGGDLRERKPSLVNVLWLKSGDSLAHELLVPNGRSITEESLKVGLRTVREHVVVEEAKRLALSYVDGARASLAAAIKSSKVKIDDSGAAALSALVQFVTERDW